MRGENIMRVLRLALVMTILAVGPACYGYFFDGFDPNTYNAPPTMGQGSISVDGDLSDWAGAEWVVMDQAYFGTAPDLSDCKYAVRWETNTLYVAVTCVDTDQNFLETSAAWNGQDDVEIYIDAGNNNTTDYGVTMADAQQYVMGPKPGGGAWIILGDGTVSIPGSPAVVSAVSVVGDVISYELSVPSWSDMPTTVKDLAAGDIVGVDVVVGSKSSSGFGMVCNNTLGDKWKWADRIQDWELVSDSWGSLETLTHGVIPGTNGWVPCYSAWVGAAFPASASGLAGVAEEPLAYWANGTYAGFSGAGRSIALDVIDGQYELTMAMYGQYHAAGYTDSKYLEVGDSKILTGPGASGNSYIIFVDDRNTVNWGGLITVRDGVRDPAEDVTYPGGFNGADYVWWEFKIVVDMVGGTASAYWRDVDDVDKQPIGGGGWTKMGDFPGPIPFDSLDAACFGLNDYARADNFTSGFAGQTREPANCAEVIGLGMGLASDLNEDCDVNLLDMALLSSDWLRCIEPFEAGCETPWRDD